VATTNNATNYEGRYRIWLHSFKRKDEPRDETVLSDVVEECELLGRRVLLDPIDHGHVDACTWAV
jgi:hypothetical protein